MQDDLLLGGIVITDLNPDRIADTDNTALRQYLETFAPLPLTYEYISMYCDTDDRTYTNITFRVNDPETGLVPAIITTTFSKRMTSATTCGLTMHAWTRKNNVC